MYPAYVLKHNPNRKKHVILLITPNGEGRKRSKTFAMTAESKQHNVKSEGQRFHYLAVKNYQQY